MRLGAFVCLGYLLLSWAYPTLSHAASLVVNEFMASNGVTLADEDGNYEDWIELHNTGASTVNLDGYGLSDDRSVQRKWTLPDINIEPNGFLMIYASGKDRTDLSTYWDRSRANHWETIITQGDRWRYLATRAEPPADWRAIEFDDSGWKEGSSGFGYGAGEYRTEVGPFLTSLYIKKTFSIADMDGITHMLLHMDYDDAFVAYLNDVEIARANIGASGDRPVHNQAAASAHEAVIHRGGVPEPFWVANVSRILRPRDNVLAIQVHNANLTSAIAVVPFLTLGMETPPPGFSEGVPALLHSSPRLHTNFRLSGAGEFIGICDRSGTVVDTLIFREQIRDVSYGRQPDGEDHWRYFAEPTPGTPNNMVGFTQPAEPPIFSHDAGFYDDAVPLALTPSSPHAHIHYTLDGSDPTESSAEYSAPIVIDTTTVVRVRTFGQSLLPSPITTRTYLIGESFSLPVVSLATDPPNLWDGETGIYTLGDDYDPAFPQEANFYQDWERPVHIEYFESDGSPGFHLDAGVKIHGNITRTYGQKSLRIHCRARYGAEKIAYRIFDDKPIDEFKTLILRNSGNDWKSTLFRDALLHNLAMDTDVDRTAYKPAIVFLNGVFWGIHNIRERQDKHYFQSNRGVDPEQVEILENWGSVIEGDAAHYAAMMEYIRKHPLRIQENFERVQTLMDTDNFIDYCVFQIYCANTDWPANNVKHWRPRTPDGRWKWALSDTDFGFGLYVPADHNTLAFATATDGPSWPNPPWATFLLRKLLENESFRTDFINRFADHMNSTLLSERVNSMIGRMRDAVSPYMPRHIRRWRHSITGPLEKRWAYTISNWYHQIYKMRHFVGERANHVREHIVDKFGLAGEARVTVAVSPGGGGRIRINTLTIESSPWSGVYFRGVPVELTAIPDPGYAFAGWSDRSLPDTSSVRMDLAGDRTIMASFAIDPDTPADPIVINEINYNSDGTFDPGDWIELHNIRDYPVDVSEWCLSDEDHDHGFVFPGNTIISPHGYLVLCRTSSDFHALFPEVDNYIGDLGFGLSGAGGLIELCDDSGHVVDSLVYDDDAPWPTEPDGNGPTLELLNPTFDNALAQSWVASLYHGTPGRMNRAAATTLVEITVTSTLPEVFSLSQNHPNPFNAQTILTYDVAKAGTVRLLIYTLTSQHIRTLADGEHPAGSYSVIWDGRDSVGREVASGAYLCQMQTDSYRAVRKMLLVK